MTHVAFLRAVNLGRRRVNMSSLVEVVGGLGYSDVWTHVNSGNVVFEASGTRSALEQRFETALEDDLGFEVTTFVRTVAELRRALALEPFELAPGDTYFVTFLKDVLSKPKATMLEELSNDFDTLVVKGRDVHWCMRGKSTDTNLTTKAWENIVGHHRSTSRNTTMLRRLMDKVEARK
jgi:uncharacterized protein (DUF1697 family)